MQPLCSRFLFQFFKEATGQSDSEIYSWLYLVGSSGGSRFKNGLKGRCWWPRHSNWFSNLDFLTNCNEAVYRRSRQAFPCPGHETLNSVLPEEQYTFESCVYDTLLTVFQRYFHNDLPAVLDFFRTLAAKWELHPAVTRQLLSHTDLSELARFLVLQAKAAKSQSLTIAYIPAPDSSPGWQVVTAHELNMDWLAISRRIEENEAVVYRRLPSACQGTNEHWAQMYRLFDRFCHYLVDPSGEIQGNFSIIGLSPDQEQALVRGKLMDAKIDFSLCNPLRKRGEYAIYLVDFNVNPLGTAVSAYNKLWGSFISLIKDCARAGIFFSKIYYKAYLPEQEARVAGRGFDYLCRDSLCGKVYVHGMDADTTLQVLDSELAQLYRLHHAPAPDTNTRRVKERLDSENAYLSFFREIDELFIQDRFCMLKPYFFDGLPLPEDESTLRLGVAVAELLRDILQYSSAFLDYLPDYRRTTFNEYSRVLMESPLIRHSMQQYQFTTERNQELLVRMGYTATSITGILAFARMWTGIDRLFLTEELLPLRPYFYEWKDRMPPDADVELALAVAVRILSTMRNAEELLSFIPHPFVISYFDFKKMTSTICLVQEALRRYPFLKEEVYP